MAANIKAHPAVIGLISSRLKLEKRGNEYWASCPFHDDHTPSFSVRKGDSGEWVYYCFGCGAQGDPIDFLRKKDGIGFGAAKKILEDATQGDWEEARKQSDEVFHKLESSQVAEEVSLEKFGKFELWLYESKEAQEWLFKERGITYDAARRLHFGFCQSLDAVTTRYNKEELKDIVDKGWIVFPAIQDGKILCIETRSIVSKVTRMRTGMTNKVLFGVDQISVDSPIFVTEGKFDQAVLVQAGYNAVSLPNASSSLTPDMRDALMSAPVRFLAGDNDGGAGSTKMEKMWREFQESTYLVKWPAGCKDANDVFLGPANRDVSIFRGIVDKLITDAYANPLPGVKSLEDILQHDDSGKTEDREDRFRFSTSAVDKMANIVPGNVVYVSATQTSTGKTTWLLQETLHAARKHDEVILNYQTEMQDEEIGELVTANLLAKDRGDVTSADRKEAAKRLRGALYYVGNNPNLNNATEVLDLIEAGIRRVGATTVVLDHLHFICRNEKDEYKGQAQAMQRIKRMAQKYLCKFFVVGQPRKPSEKAQGKPLDIYSAKGSEAIVSDADVVYFLHRDTVKNMTEETQDTLSPEVQIRCMKGRKRGKGAAMVKLFFLGKIATFREIVPVEEPNTQTEFDY